MRFNVGGLSTVHVPPPPGAPPPPPAPRPTHGTHTPSLARSPIAQVVALDTDQLCANANQGRGAVGTEPEPWTANNYVHFDPVPTAAADLYVCLSNNWGSANQIFSRLYHTGTAPLTLVTVRALPTYLPLNAYAGHTLIIRLSSADVASSTTQVRLAENARCPRCAPTAVVLCPMRFSTASTAFPPPQRLLHGPAQDLRLGPSWVLVWMKGHGQIIVEEERPSLVTHRGLS